MLCIAGKNLAALQVLAGVPRHFDVVSLPNPADTGEDDWQPSFRRVAEKLGVPIVSLDDLYGEEDLCFLSLEYSEIIRPQRFTTDRLFNVHFSLLPKYRGCNTSIWPILNGEEWHGVTLHWIDPGVDTGPIITQRSFCLDDMTAFDVYMRCQLEAVQMVLPLIDDLVSSDDLPRSPQPGDPAYVGRQWPPEEIRTYRRNELDFRLKEIDLSEPTAQVIRRIRAFTFPAYQMPTFDGREITDYSTDPIEGYEPVDAADGKLWLNFA